MLCAKQSFLDRLRKNDLSFYCLLAVLSLSAAGGFVFSVTVQTISLIVLAVCLSISVAEKYLKNKTLLLVILPLAAVFFSYLGADFQVNVRNASLGLLNAVIAFFVVVYSSSKNKENILLFLIFLGMWVSFLLFAQFFAGNNDIDQSLSLNINILSGFLLLIYPLIFGFAQKNKYSGFFIAIAFIVFAAIIMTKSRTSIFLAYAVTIFYFVKLKKSGFLTVFFIAVSVFVIAGAAYAFYAKTGWKSFSERVLWWETAVLMFKDYPAFGIGFGNYSALFLYYRPEPVLNTMFAHNTFLQIIAETGLAGIAFFGAAFYAVFKTIRISFKNKSGDIAHMRSAVVSLLAFLVLNIAEYSFYIPVCMMAFFVICGFLCAQAPEYREKRVPYWITGLPALIIIYLFIPAALAEQYYSSGQKHAADKNYETAKKHYLKAIRHDKKNSEYYHQAADVSFRLYVLSGQNEKSYLEETINFELESEKFYTHSAQIKGGLANLYNLKGDAENAGKYAAAARKADKFNPHYGSFK